MEVSIIGIILILLFLAYFIIYGKHVYEQFQNPPFIPLAEGFESSTNDLEITTCPSLDSPASVFINSVGQNLCCNGMVESNKCMGDVICSLSEGTGTIPTCTEWYKTYLEEKGTLRCPADLPNYFENRSGDSGCTSGPRTKDGTAPLTSTQPYCNIYAKQADNESDVDSCYNKKRLDAAVCFNTPGIKSTKKLMYNGAGNPATVQCSFIDPSGNSYTCTTDSSMQRLVAANLPAGQTIAEWKAGSANWDLLYKLQFCSALEKYKITQTIQPEASGSNTLCIPNFKIF